MTKAEKSRATVVTTRPSGQGINVCRALRRRGFVAWNLPAVRLSATTDEAAVREALIAAASGDALIFTSPAAVHHAIALWPTGLAASAHRFAVGESTARALQRAGLGPVLVPVQATSEGLLAMEQLAQVRGRKIAIVGAPGGRPLLGDCLTRRGADLSRVNVYQRLPARWDARHWRALESVRQPVVTTLTSAQSMARLSSRLPEMHWQRLRAGTAVASSPRLAQLARKLGFSRVERARSATDVDLIAAIAALF